MSLTPSIHPVTLSRMVRCLHSQLFPTVMGTDVKSVKAPPVLGLNVAVSWFGKYSANVHEQI